MSTTTTVKKISNIFKTFRVVLNPDNIIANLNNIKPNLSELANLELIPNLLIEVEGFPQIRVTNKGNGGLMLIGNVITLVITNEVYTQLINNKLSDLNFFSMLLYRARLEEMSTIKVFSSYNDSLKKDLHVEQAALNLLGINYDKALYDKCKNAYTEYLSSLLNKIKLYLNKADLQTMELRIKLLKI